MNQVPVQEVLEYFHQSNGDSAVIHLALTCAEIGLKEANYWYQDKFSEEGNTDLNSEKTIRFLQSILVKIAGMSCQLEKDFSYEDLFGERKIEGPVNDLNFFKGLTGLLVDARNSVYNAPVISFTYEGVMNLEVEINFVNDKIRTRFTELMTEFLEKQKQVEEVAETEVVEEDVTEKSETEIADVSPDDEEGNDAEEEDEQIPPVMSFKEFLEQNAV